MLVRERLPFNIKNKKKSQESKKKKIFESGEAKVCVISEFL